MKTMIAAALLASVCAGAASAAEVPGWAYPLNAPAAPGAAPQAPDPAKHKVPNSAVEMTRAEIGARGRVPDWHPGDHPAMPKIVAEGREPQVRACGYCHTPTGVGRPENANVQGLTPAYIKQQIENFRKGERQGSEAKRVPQNLMIAIAKAVTDAEVKEAAAYFSKQKPATFVKVVESATAPETNVVGGMLAKLPGGKMEPIGSRLIEVPEDIEQAELRDPRTPYIAYVPVGSLKAGEALVATGGGGKTIQCGVCHGADLKGLGDVPWIAGRSPSYIYRQLFDIQNGTRSGSAALMKQVVAKLTNDDMIAISAYVGSKAP